MMFTSVLLFEDNDELRKSLKQLLSNSDFLVTGDYADVNRAGEIVQEMQPDIVILDINMPGISGIEAIRLIKEAKPDVSIIMYTQFEDEDKLFRSLCAGADGYILKKLSPFKLVDAIDEVRKGGAPLSPTIAKKILHSFRVRQKSLKDHFNLTPREAEIFDLLVKGYSVKLIAAETKITYDTCRTHLKNIYRKLHVNCGKEAIARVLAETVVR